MAGQLSDAHAAADHAWERWRNRDPAWAARFNLQRAKVRLYQGLSRDALDLLTEPLASSTLEAERRILRSLAEGRLGDPAAAQAELVIAEQLCDRAPTAGSRICGELPAARGSLATQAGDLPAAEAYFRESLAAARRGSDRFLETRALLNLSWISLRQEHLEDALVWATAASHSGASIRARQTMEKALGNAAWAYYQLGDYERARSTFHDAAEQAHAIGASSDEMEWWNNAGLSEYQLGHGEPARALYERARSLAMSLHNDERTQEADVTLGSMLLRSAAPARAQPYIDEAARIARQRHEEDAAISADLLTAQWRMGQGDLSGAETILLRAEADAAPWPHLRWEAEHALALVAQQRGDAAHAQVWFARAIATYHQERAQLVTDDTRLPFFANGRDLYLDAVESLISAHKDAQALAVLDEGRAETLRDGLGMSANTERTAASDPRALARRLHSTLLVYALSPEHSWLWAIDSARMRLYLLPPRATIVALLERHKRNVLAARDLAAEQDATARALFDMLVAPARSVLPHGSRVVILSDDALAGLNFETLLTSDTPGHYWIEDVTLTQAASLRLLDRDAARSRSVAGAARLLLIGDPVYAGQSFAPLPHAPEEVRDVGDHFAPGARLLLTGAHASPAAYVRADPSNYSYIHFVAHAVANETTPLDSAVILSPSPATGAEKLYARSILNKPLHADLVTLSACQGSGVRSYAGEGLVGLSWAFLRAGARNVIGALWDVSDVSTPQLMGSLYDQLQHGAPANVALRAAKLEMLHSRGVFRKPLYWGAFQLYAGGGSDTHH